MWTVFKERDVLYVIELVRNIYVYIPDLGLHSKTKRRLVGDRQNQTTYFERRC